MIFRILIVIGVLIAILCVWGFRRHTVPLEYVQSYFAETALTDEQGNVLMGPMWLSRFCENSDQGNVFDKYLGEDYPYEYDIYTYYLSSGFTIRKLTYRRLDYQGVGKDEYKRYVGSVELGLDCERNEVILYRTPRINVESPEMRNYDNHLKIIGK